MALAIERTLESDEDVHFRMLQAPRPYEGMNINGITGLTAAQIASLKALGAVEDAA